MQCQLGNYDLFLWEGPLASTDGANGQIGEATEELESVILSLDSSAEIRFQCIKDNMWKYHFLWTLFRKLDIDWASLVAQTMKSAVMHETWVRSWVRKNP